MFVQNMEEIFRLPLSHGHVPNFFYLIELSSEESEEDKEHTCETLLMCIVTVLSHGLRSGGGVGDVLRKPSKEVN